jgi:Flp pilus assembly protein TadG
MRQIDDRGALSLEYAALLPVFLSLVFGIMDLGRLVWTQVTLDRAVQAAARCAAINSVSCGTDAAVQTYATTQTWGVTTSAGAFTVTHPSCGVSVSATLSFQLVVPWPGSNLSSLSASACYPKLS